MSNLTLRVVTAGVAAPILVTLILIPVAWPMWLLVYVATAVGLYEWGTMTLGVRSLAERVLVILLGLAVAASIYYGDATVRLLTLAGATIVGLTYFLCRYGELGTVAARFGVTMAGVLYVGVLLTFLALLKRRPEGRYGEWVFLTLTLTWFGDTFAYFAGRALGRRKLYPAISPGKTIEGALGGLLGSIVAVVIAKAWYLAGTLAWWDCLALAIPAGALGQVGDLCESMIKRACRVKDSGVIIPGHGGILDRIDALLFSTPIVYAYAAVRFGL